MSGFWKVFITAFVSTVIVGGITFYFMNQKLVADNKDKDTKISDLTKQVADLGGTTASTSATTTPATADATADWKTYTNTTYGFSFKYPSDYTKNDLDNGGVSINSATTGGYERPNLFMVQITQTSKTLAQFLQEQQTDKTFFDQKAITFAGKTAYEGVDAGLTNTYGIYVENNSKILSITLDSGNKDTLSANKASLTTIQNQILSSFQFSK